MNGRSFEKALAKARDRERRKAELLIDVDGTEKVVSKFDPPSRELFGAKSKPGATKAKRGRK